MKKTKTPYKHINSDVFFIYNEKVQSKWNQAVARKTNDNLITWSQDGKGKVATLSKTGDEVYFEIN